MKINNIFNSKFLIINSQRGQALVMLLFFMIIAITITSAAVAVIAANSLSSNQLQQGYTARDVAESGAENALLRIIRDPSYTGETMQVGAGTAVIQVSSASGTFYATSSGSLNNDLRKIQVTAVYNNSVLTVQSWNEIF